MGFGVCDERTPHGTNFPRGVPPLSHSNGERIQLCLARFHVRSEFTRADPFLTTSMLIGQDPARPMIHVGGTCRAANEYHIVPEEGNNKKAMLNDGETGPFLFLLSETDCLCHALTGGGLSIRSRRCFQACSCACIVLPDVLPLFVLIGGGLFPPLCGRCGEGGGQTYPHTAHALCRLEKSWGEI